MIQQIFILNDAGVLLYHRSYAVEETDPWLFSSYLNAFCEFTHHTMGQDLKQIQMGGRLLTIKRGNNFTVALVSERCEGCENQETCFCIPETLKETHQIFENIYPDLPDCLDGASFDSFGQIFDRILEGHFCRVFFSEDFSSALHCTQEKLHRSEESYNPVQCSDCKNAIKKKMLGAIVLNDKTLIHCEVNDLMEEQIKYENVFRVLSLFDGLTSRSCYPNALTIEFDDHVILASYVEPYVVFTFWRPDTPSSYFEQLRNNMASALLTRLTEVNPVNQSHDLSDKDQSLTDFNF